MHWSTEGAYLTLPDGKKLKVPVVNHCPYVDKEILRVFEELKKKTQERKPVREYIAKT